MQQKQLVSIQYLRGFAAISVVIFHQLQHRAGGIFNFGMYGVDLFFVISGFIMVAMTDERPTTPLQFLKDRVIRIVPIYWIATLAAFILISVGVDMPSGNSSIEFALKSLFFVPEKNLNNQFWPTLFLGWTLNYEMFFYGIFAVLLFFGKQLRFLMLTAILIGLVFLGHTIEDRSDIIRFYSSPLVIEFAVGGALAKLFGMKHTTFTLKKQILGTFLLISLLLLGSLYHRQLAIAAGCVLLVATLLIWERSGRLPHIEIAKHFGDASFSIYLFQQFAFLMVFIPLGLLQKMGLIQTKLGPIPSLAAILVAIIFGLMVYRFLEVPILKFFKRHKKASV